MAANHAIDPMPSDVARACQAICKAGSALPFDTFRQAERAQGACSFGRILGPVVEVLLAPFGGETGIEPATPGLIFRCSVQLSYSQSSLHVVPKLFTERSRSIQAQTGSAASRRG